MGVGQIGIQENGNSENWIWEIGSGKLDPGNHIFSEPFSKFSFFHWFCNFAIAAGIIAILNICVSNQI